MTGEILAVTGPACVLGTVLVARSAATRLAERGATLTVTFKASGPKPAATTEKGTPS